MSGAEALGRAGKNKAFFFSYREKLTLIPLKNSPYMNRLFLPGRIENRATNHINRLTGNRVGGGIDGRAKCDASGGGRSRMLLFAAPLLLAALMVLNDRVEAQGPHFSHQTIFVTDLDRAANFYEKVMELKRIPEPFHDGKHVWFRISEHGQLHVVSGAKEDIPHDINIHLAFSVPSMAAFTKHLDEYNVKYGNWAQNDKTPQLRPDKVQQVYLQDPDGYWIEVNDDKF